MKLVEDQLGARPPLDDGEGGLHSTRGGIRHDDQHPLAAA